MENDAGRAKSMIRLADIALQYFLIFTFGGDGEGLDLDAMVREMESFPEMVKALSTDERAAIACAARERLEVISRPPDEYGYKPQVPDKYVDVLEWFADGTFHGWLD